LSEVKRYKIAGEIKKGKTRIPFAVEMSALKQEHALQRLYADMGSRHRARKFEITINSVEQVNEEVKAARNGDSTSK
jgi:ribosomal protein L20A (L18A)